VNCAPCASWTKRTRSASVSLCSSQRQPSSVTVTARLPHTPHGLAEPILSHFDRSMWDILTGRV
jgi:hypothetical protein